MKARLALAAAASLAGVAAVAQLRITHFNSSGDLTWTNFANQGAYRVEWADSLDGRWRQFDTNLNAVWALTNRVTVRLPLSNSPAFYRVAWTPPEPIGVWDYRAYDG